MPSLKSLRMRRAAVQSTRKITSAMRIVSNVNVRQAQGMLQESQQVLDHLKYLWSIVCRDVPLYERGFSVQNDAAEKTLVLTITGDRGLCGVFHNAVAQKALNFCENHITPCDIHLVGRKNKKTLLPHYHYITPKLSCLRAEAFKISQHILNQRSTYRTIVMVYQHFTNILKQEPRVVTLYPLLEEPSKDLKEYYTYDTPSTLPNLASMLFHGKVFYYFCHHFLSEYASRLMAMDGATQNAEKIGDNITLLYNKIRQDSITKELIEVVSGSMGLSS